MRQVGRRRAARVAALALGREVAVARGVVVAHAREQLQLERLVAAPVVDDPGPLTRDGVQRGRAVHRRLHERVLDRVRRADRRAPGGELDRRGTVERDGDLQLRVGGVVAVGVVQRLDRVADGVRVEEVDEQAVRHARASCRMATLRRVLRMALAGIATVLAAAAPAPATRAEPRPLTPRGSELRVVVLPIAQPGNRVPSRAQLDRTLRRTRSWFARSTYGRIRLTYAIAPPIARPRGPLEEGIARFALRRAAARGIDGAGAVPVLIEATRTPCAQLREPGPGPAPRDVLALPPTRSPTSWGTRSGSTTRARRPRARVRSARCAAPTGRATTTSTATRSTSWASAATATARTVWPCWGSRRSATPLRAVRTTRSGRSTAVARRCCGFGPRHATTSPTRAGARRRARAAGPRTARRGDLARRARCYTPDRDTLPAHAPAPGRRTPSARAARAAARASRARSSSPAGRSPSRARSGCGCCAAAARCASPPPGSTARRRRSR